MQRYKGFLLSKSKYREHDELLVLYLEHVGKVSAIIPGSLRKKNKYNGKIELFTEYYFDIEIRHNLSKIYQFELVKRWNTDEDNVLKLFLNGSKINEFLKKSLPERQAISGLFFLVENLYDFICKGSMPQLALVYLQQKMISYLGMPLCFEHCIGCGSTEHIIAFSIDQGGILCKDCLIHADFALVDTQQLKLLIAFDRVDISKLADIQMSDADCYFLESFWKELYANQLGVVLSSQKVII